MFNSKFTHISPVWYDLKSQGSGLVLEGRHNADIGWISDLRMAGDAWVLPRIVLEAFPAELLTKKKQRNKVIDLIVSECKEMGYDGIVLEPWSRWAAYLVLHDSKMRDLALRFIKDLGDALHAVTSERIKHRWQLVYVIGPPHSENLQVHDFGPKDLQSLSDAVDGFSLMTYDFLGPHNPGPNAPLNGSVPPSSCSLVTIKTVVWPARYFLVSISMETITSSQELLVVVLSLEEITSPCWKSTSLHSDGKRTAQNICSSSLMMMITIMLCSTHRYCQFPCG